MAAAHKMRIVHRDVKPGNILIAEDGSALISDFGISHALGDTTITATGMIHGTPAYLAPEVARGLPTSFASDVFSLGSTLYAMLEGTPPFGTENNAIALLHKVARGGYPAPRHAGPLAPLLRVDAVGRPEAAAEHGVRRASHCKAADDGNGAVAAAAALPWPFDELAENADEVPTEPLGGSPPGSGDSDRRRRWSRPQRHDRRRNRPLRRFASTRRRLVNLPRPRPSRSRGALHTDRGRPSGCRLRPPSRVAEDDALPSPSAS